MEPRVASLEVLRAFPVNVFLCDARHPADDIKISWPRIGSSLLWSLRGSADAWYMQLCFVSLKFLIVIRSLVER